MKRAAVIIGILLGAAGVAWLQTLAPTADPATLMPSGALLYVRAADFGRLIGDWNGSAVKRDWLASDNYAVFAQSNLFQKLGGVYDEYSKAMGFTPGLAGVGEIAGGESALALYDIRDVQFVYLSRIGETQLSKARLWAQRSHFEQRETAGTPFWLRQDAASGRTIAFAFARGWLFVATRDDLIAQSLQLLAGSHDLSVASEHWYSEAASNAGTAGELRLVMNLDTLVKSTYFRSYWVQRNASDLRPYWAGIADLNRGATAITESRVLLRSADNPGKGPSAEDRAVASQLVAMAPDDAGLYRVWAAPDAATASMLIVDKLIAPPVETSGFQRYAPSAIDLSATAGTEADLETRIDEPPLPSETTVTNSAGALRATIEKAGVRAMIEVQSTTPAGRTFMRMPCMIVLASSVPWDEAAIQAALAQAVEPLWTTGGLGAGWRAATVGARLDGLGRLYAAVRGNVLYLANDEGMFGSILNRAAAVTTTGRATYTALFRAARERQNYDHLTQALDFVAPLNETAFGISASSTETPAFFSRDMASLARVLSPVTQVRITREDDGGRVLEKVEYTWRR